MGFNLKSIIGSGLGGLVKDVVGTFKLSPEKQAEMDVLIEQHAADIRVKELELQAKLQDAITAEVQAAASNIQAETKSEDKVTARARPMFMYVVEFILAWNYVIVPLFKQAPVTLPEPLFWLFGSCILGYTGARSWDKYAEKIGPTATK